MSNRINRLYEFGEFRFDAESKTLWKGEKMISLSPKALDVLFLLLQNEGSLVLKQEILNTVWSDTFVEDGVLTQNIYTLRQSLGKDAAGNQLIENIARRGYRFTAPVRKSGGVLDEQVSEADKLGAPFGFVSTTEREQRESIPRKQYWIYGSFAALILIGIFAAFYIFFRPAKENIENRSPIAPIEQLKFDRLTDSGDVLFPTISPNGEFIAFVRIDESEESVWIRPINSENANQILPPSKKGYPGLAFSPDGRSLYFRERESGGAIYQVPFLGGNRKKVADDVWSDFSVSPDGSQFAFVRRKKEIGISWLIIAGTDGTGEKGTKFLKNYRSFILGRSAGLPTAPSLQYRRSSCQIRIQRSF